VVLASSGLNDLFLTAMGILDCVVVDLIQIVVKATCRVCVAAADFADVLPELSSSLKFVPDRWRASINMLIRSRRAIDLEGNGMVGSLPATRRKDRLAAHLPT
jgi:hypothetical protein